MNCNVCGSTNLIKGSVSGRDASSGVGIFIPDDRPFYKQMLGIDTREIHSYGCLHCGNLQLIIDFNEKDKKKYLKFEGEQPGLLERLSEEVEESK